MCYPISMLKNALFSPAAFACCALADETVPYPGEAPGVAEARGTQAVFCLGNRALDFSVSLRPNGENGWSFPGCSLKNKTTGEEVVFAEVPFSLTLETDGEPRVYADFVFGQGSVGPLAAEPDASRAAAHAPGKVFSCSGVSRKAGVELTWRAELRDGAHYVRQSFTVKALRDIKLVGVEPIRLTGGDFAVPGEVPGTPLVHPSSHTFYGVELPVAMAKAGNGGAVIGFDCCLPMKAGEERSFTVAFGVYPEGLLRRGFLAYLEKERATPYRQFLHYNCWYDHGLNPTEENMLATVKAYGDELVRKRGIKLDSFVLDDGWDDYHSDLWQPHPGKFPNGFAPLSKAIRSIDSHFGIWISPLGGYSGATERVEHARRMGLIPPQQQGLDLSCPGYYNWFLSRCKELMEKDGVNFFKWDRAGGGVSPHFMALLHIAAELRKSNPSLFLSTTVGTWPSPFWLNYVDCIWRTGSSDVNWMGEGNNREQYITYRDAACYRLIVKRAPLFPLNSLMHHGVVLGKAFQGRRTSDARTYAGGKAQEPKPGDGDFMADTTIRTVDFPVNNDLRKDARLFFASGANLQELYLSPDMMNGQAWDDVAEAIRWAEAYADVLADAHWAGGDPEKGEVYGYAAYRQGRGATLALRNPSSRVQKVELPLNAALESSGVEALASPYADQRVQTVGRDAVIEMKPFEVLVFSARFDGKTPGIAQKEAGKRK